MSEERKNEKDGSLTLKCVSTGKVGSDGKIFGSAGHAVWTKRSEVRKLSQ